MTTLATTLDSMPPQPSPRERIGAMHQFLLRHAFYPLVLCTLLGFSFLIARAYILGVLEYRFLVWNLFLAWIPYGLSLLALHLDRSRSRERTLKLIVWASWLAMLPNAPYIVTDFIHLRRIEPLTWWFDLGLWLTFALAGCFLGVISLRIMHDLVRQHLGRTLGWVFVLIVTTLSGFGIYLGRFQRFNSWDLLTRPQRVYGTMLRGLLDPLSHSRTWGVTLMFGAMMFVTYMMFVSAARATENQR